MFQVWRLREPAAVNLSFSAFMKTIPTKQEKKYFGYFVQRDQYGIFAKNLNLTQNSVLLDTFVAAAALNS